MTRVYFIKPIGMDGPVKIGCSKAPESRRNTLEVWSPFPLEIIAEIEGGFDLERRIHALLKPSHQHREWFVATPEVMAVVEQVQKGTFDTTNLPAPISISVNSEAVKQRHKESWTPQRRMLASYSARVRWTQLKTLTISPHYSGLAYDPAKRAEIDAYLADPHAHGEPLVAYIERVGHTPYWARDITPTPSEASPKRGMAA